MTCAKDGGVCSNGNPVGTAFLRTAASPPRECFVQDVLIHCTVISTATAFQRGGYGDLSLNVIPSPPPLSAASTTTVLRQRIQLRKRQVCWDSRGRSVSAHLSLHRSQRQPNDTYGETSQTVRSLDAIHLGTALRVRSRLASFVTYDKRLADAATAAGLSVDMPS